MTSLYQNQAYQQESAPTEHLQQNLGFSPVYEQQQRASVREYQRQPPTLPYPTPPTPPLQQQPQPVIVSTHAHLHPVPAHGQQQQVPPCPVDVTAPYVNPNALPPPPPPPAPCPRVCKWNCSDFKTNCLYLLLLAISIGVPLYYVKLSR